MRKVHSDIIQFRGSHYDFGYHQGELLRDSLLLPNRKIQRGENSRQLLVDETKAIEMLERFAPRIWEEIEG